MVAPAFYAAGAADVTENRATDKTGAADHADKPTTSARAILDRKTSADASVLYETTPNAGVSRPKSPPMILLNKEAVLAAAAAETAQTPAVSQKMFPLSEPAADTSPKEVTAAKPRDAALTGGESVTDPSDDEAKSVDKENTPEEIAADTPTDTPRLPKKRVTVAPSKDKATPAPLHAGMRLFDRLDPFRGETKETDYWDLAWHARLADYGDAQSQYVVAAAYETGRHTAKNKQKALYFYKAAAQNGHVEAALRLGRIYESGLLGDTDRDQALFWYDTAGKRDSVPALLAASELCRTGDAADYEKSYDYLKRAMTLLFPNESDLEKVSPELADLRKQIIPFSIQKATKRIKTDAETVDARCALFLKNAQAAADTADKKLADVTDAADAAAAVVPGVEILTPAGFRPIYRAGDDPVLFLTQRLMEMHQAGEAGL